MALRTRNLRGEKCDVGIGKKDEHEKFSLTYFFGPIRAIVFLRADSGFISTLWWVASASNSEKGSGTTVSGRHRSRQPPCVRGQNEKRNECKIFTSPQKGSFKEQLDRLRETRADKRGEMGTRKKTDNLRTVQLGWAGHADIQVRGSVPFMFGQ